MRLLVIMCCLTATLFSDLSVGGGLTCDPCTCLHDGKYGGLYVRCSDLNLTTVPRSLPSTVTTLLLNKNHITSLPNRAFYWLTNLRELDLSGNNFTSLLDPDVFVGLRQLLLLNIDNTVLIDCNFTLTDNFIKLQYLKPLINLRTLSALNLRFLYCVYDPSVPPCFHNVYIGNNIPQTLKHIYIDCMSCLFSESFSSLSNLTHVSVSNSAGSDLCILYKVQKATFQSLIHVKTLNLSGCRIRYLNPGVFSSLKDLRHLDIRFKTLFTKEKKYLFYNATMSLSPTIEVIRHTYHEETDLDKSVFTFLQNTSLTELHFNAHLMTMAEHDAFFYLPKTIETLSLQKFIFKSVSTFGVVWELRFLRKLDLSDSLLREDGYCLLCVIPERIKTFICVNCRCRTLIVVSSDNFNPNNSISHLNLANTDIGRLYKKENKDLYKRFTSFISLDISSNHLWLLPQDIFLYSKHLRVLNLSDNLLQTIDFVVSSLTHLETFDLSNNKLSLLRSSTRKDLETMPNVSVRLQGNPLSCSCEELDFLQWIQQHRSNIFELSQLSCRMSGDRKISFSQLNYVVHQLEEQCKSNVVKITVSVSIVVSFLAVMAACLGYRNRWKLRYLYHVGRRGYRRRQQHRCEDDAYQYDAFVSYADEDRKFVIDSMMPELEGKCGMKLCIHHRDFLPGEVIATNIVNAIQNSRKTLIILSPSFLRSSWCEYEYNMARMEGVTRRQEVVLVVLYEYVSIRDLPKDMTIMLRRNCYLEYNEDMFGNEVFWQNVEESIRTNIPKD